MDKNNQTSEEIVVSKRTSIIPIMAFLVVLLTTLPWIGAFMLRKYKIATVMLLIQIVIVVCGRYTMSGSEVGGWAGLAAGLFIPPWLCVWLWGLILTVEAVLTNNGLNAKDMDKNNQTSEEIVVSKGMSIMAFYVVLLTTLSFIGAFMLQRKKVAIVMSLIQIVLVVCVSYVTPGYQGGGEWFSGLNFLVLIISLWLGVWLWGLILTAKVALAHNGLTVLARRTIITAVSLVSLFTFLYIGELYILLHLIL